MCEPLFTRFQNVIDKLMIEIYKKDVKKSDIDEVLLVGGTSLIPRIQRIVNSYFSLKSQIGSPKQTLQAVAKGAAIYAYNMAMSNVDTLVTDVTPFTLGIPTVPRGYNKHKPDMTRGQPKRFLPIIKANTNIPVEVVLMVGTTRRGQKSMNLNIYAGDNELVKHNRLVQTFRLTYLHRRRSGKATAKLVYRLDESGVLNVTAMEERSDGTGVINRTAVVVGYLPHQLNNPDLELNPREQIESVLGLVMKHKVLRVQRATQTHGTSIRMRHGRDKAARDPGSMFAGSKLARVRET